MKKRFFSCIAAFVLLLAMIPAPRTAAAQALVPDRPCSLKLHYRWNGTGCAGVEIEIYRVAEAFPDGTWELIEPYSGYPVNIHGITAQQEWKDTATTLASYIASGQLQPTASVTTDQSGTASFAQLTTGLYLVLGVDAQTQQGSCHFEDFMIYLPTPQADGSFSYDMEANPKPSGTSENQEFTVRKLWKDAGNSGSRPHKVVVDILHNGIRKETVVLNAQNFWTYTWQTTETGGRWSVVERDVPEGYTVSVSVRGNCFTVTNSRPQQDPGSFIPKTGDTFPLMPAILVMSISGMLLLILGIWKSRRK